VRPAGPADAKGIAALWTEAFTEDARGGRETPYEEAEAIEAIERGDVWIVEDAALIAVVVLYPGGARSGQIARQGELELSRLAVAKSARRRGIAHELTELCLREASGRGARVIVLWSQPHQVEAHQLYESLRFLRKPERDKLNEEGRQLVFVRQC
jgi:putative acetyltransferase